MAIKSVQFPLSVDGQHSVRLNISGKELEVELIRDSGSRRSALHGSFCKHLWLGLGTAREKLGANGTWKGPFGEAQSLRVCLGQREEIELAQISLVPMLRVVRGPYRLAPFETRYLAENGHPHPAPGLSEQKFDGLLTDLHVHFAGCVSGPELVAVGTEVGAVYPPALLIEAGIDAGAAPVALSALPWEGQRALASALSIPLDRQITFLEMERIYRMRSPITKHPAAFLPLLKRIARDYAGFGARYVELSISNILEADRLALVHRETPALEREFGVTLRFLAALSRHDDYEWDLDCIARIAELSRSRYLAGVDFMGHETNSTLAFAPQLKSLAEWADSERPGFVIRVHAGENPAHPENVRAAVDAVVGKRVQLRIGHGLYGVDDATLAKLRESGTIVEFNLNSNFALNNVQSSGEVPLRRYLENGVRVVLGTDGYGIYQSNLGLEAQSARLCGVSIEQLRKIRRIEEYYIQGRGVHEAHATLPPAEFVPPPDPPTKHYTPELMSRKVAQRAARHAALQEKLAAHQLAPLDAEGLEKLLRGRMVVSVAGAWANSWTRIAPEQREIVARTFDQLLAAWDPKQTVLITGGTEFGVEGLVQAAARKLGFTTLGTLVWETAPDVLAPEHLSHVHIVAESLYDKAGGLYAILKEYNGLCIFVGGGTIVSDEIQTAANLRLRYFLMDGPAGASTEHAREQPERAFRSGEELLQRLQSGPVWSAEPEPYWHLGANPTVDLVVTRKNPSTQQLEVLLIRRDEDAPAEPGKWALPGGFQLTDSPRGSPWLPGREAASEACVREVLEETGLDLRALETQMLRVGAYEGNGRDPRDTRQAWSKTIVFALHLPDALSGTIVAGGDDAREARWVALDARPKSLAFDHARLLEDGLRLLDGIR